MRVSKTMLQLGQAPKHHRQEERGSNAIAPCSAKWILKVLPKHLLKFAVLFSFAASSHAQFAPQVTLATPLNTLSNSFYENTGVNFGFRHDTPTSSMFFNNGLGQAVPAFGGFDPGAQSSFGMQGRRGNWSWNLGLTGGQGNSRSSVSTTPMLTVPNGGFGFINDSMSRPFVTGIIPVVGSRAMAQQAELNRQRFRQQFDQATAIVKAKRQAEEEKRADELRQAKEKSSSAPASRKRLDAPLVLRPAAPPTADTTSE